MEATVDTQGIRLPSKDEPLDREAAEFVKRATMDSDEEDSAEDDSAEERENAESDLFAAVNNRCNKPYNTGYERSIAIAV